MSYCVEVPILDLNEQRSNFNMPIKPKQKISSKRPLKLTSMYFNFLLTSHANKTLMFQS